MVIPTWSEWWPYKAPPRSPRYPRNKEAISPKAVSPANPPLPEATAAAGPWKLSSAAPKHSREGYGVLLTVLTLDAPHAPTGFDLTLSG